MRAPRMRSSSRAEDPSSSLVPSRTLPRARPLALSNPSAARKIWLLPAPDSPTTPTHSPGATSRLTPCTARMSPPGAVKLTSRSRMQSASTAGTPAGLVSVLMRIQCIPQSIAQRVETDQQADQQSRRDEQQPGGGLHLLGAIVDQTAEAGQRLLHA